jgi:hypothetical protein
MAVGQGGCRTRQPRNQCAEILLVVSQAGVIEHHHFHRMPVAPEMFVVNFNGFGDIAQAVSRYDENGFGGLHIESGVKKSSARWSENRRTKQADRTACAKIRASWLEAPPLARARREPGLASARSPRDHRR